MLYALALAYDPTQRRCDLVVSCAGGRIGLFMDASPATPLIVALGSERRAEPDDVLPDGLSESTLQAGLDRRRGWAGDRLMTGGARLGSRLWLDERSKLTQETMQSQEDYAMEATADFPARLGLAVSVQAARAGADTLQLRVRAGAATGPAAGGPDLVLAQVFA